MSFVKEDPQPVENEYKDETGSVALAAYTPNSPEEKKLLRKLDFRIGEYTLSYRLLGNIV